MTDIALAPSTRHDGWTTARQRSFLESLATLGMVRRAAAVAGMSHEAAYRLRHRHDGAAFRLGWDAALLLARDALADMLMERAIEGQEDVIVRDDDGRTRTRTRHDNRLALALLSRLDRFADDNHVAHADARTVAGAWEAFLDLVETGGDRVAIDEFLDARRPSGPAGNNVDEPCQLPDDGEDEEVDDFDDWLREIHMVWWSREHGEYRTNFPPPPGFTGHQQGNPERSYELNGYQRSLSTLETERHVENLTSEAEERAARLHEMRRKSFGIDEGEESDAPCSDVAVPVS